MTTEEERIGTRQLLLDQFDIAWALADYHLGGLTTEECLWQPTTPGLHVHLRTAGTWQADWPDSEGYDIGMPSIAWITWHICYWWTNAIAGMNGEGAVDRHEIIWPGSAGQTREAIGLLRDRWRSLVADSRDENRCRINPVSWPIPDQSLDSIAAWLNLELMKNAAEIGAVRFLYATRQNRIA